MSSVEVARDSSQPTNPRTSTASNMAEVPRRPLSMRLASFFFLTSLLLVALTSAILYNATLSALQYADDQVALKRLQAIHEILDVQDMDLDLVAHEVSEDNQGPRQIFIRVVTPFQPLQLETPLMKARLPQSLFPDVSTAQLGEEKRATITTSSGDTYRALAKRVAVSAKPGPEFAVIQVATDTTLDNDSIALFRKILFVVLGAAVPLCAAASWFLVKRELKPLEAITNAAEKIDGSTLHHTINVAGLPEELHRLATQFNLMLCRLEETYSRLKDYADNIAHELRTPLSRIRLRSELALRQVDSSSPIHETLSANVDDSETVSKLLDQLLFLARTDHTKVAIAFAPFPLERACRTVYDFFEAAAEVKGIRLSYDVEPGLQMRGDRELIQRAVANLVSNAIDQSRSGDVVMLRAARGGSGTLITVSDTGPGISAKHQQHIFDRFYRVSEIQAADGEHLGLGLAITKSIVEMHGGQISVASHPGNGTVFTMVFA